MNELISALTRLANAAALYLENSAKVKAGITSVIDSATATAAEHAKKERKPRSTKAEPAIDPAVPTAAAPAAAVPAAAAAPADPLAELGLGASPAAAVPAPAPAPAAALALTPEQSTLEMKKIAVKCVQLFKNDTPNGEACLTELLHNRFKVQRLSELTHDGRMDFIAQVQTVIVNGGKA